MTPERLQQIKERYDDEMIRREHVAELIDTVDHLTADNARLRAGALAGLTYESCGTNRLGQPTRRLVGPVEVEP